MTDLPISTAIPELKAALSAQPIVLLGAATGSGKTTVVPLALLNEIWLAEKKILMLEPRRLAARAAANRMADTLQENVGQTVGYQLRLDRKISAQTRIEVVTEGILTRRIQSDPELADIGLLIFDEFHERNLQGDLGLALALDVLAGLRDDLRILIMSATLDLGGLQQRIATTLPEPAIVEAEGRSFPVAIEYLGSRRRQGHLFRHHVDEALRGIRAAIEINAHDILVFLPGAGEIRAVAEILCERYPDRTIAPLYGELEQAAQDSALRALRGRKRIVLATAIAETSLTIPGIDTVVDVGWSRVARFDPNTAMTALETIRVSRAAADQRAGRAGRTGPGRCLRLWSVDEHGGFASSHPPELLSADLSPLVLEIAAWGSLAKQLFWLDPPPTAALTQAQELLQQLDALDSEGRITAHGRAMLEIGAPPRLAHLLVKAPDTQSADLAALLSERDLRRGRDLPSDVDICVRLRWLQTKGHTPAECDRRALDWVRKIAQRWRQHTKANSNSTQSDASRIILAYPDRIAKQRPAQPGHYLLANGRGAWLDPSDPLAQSEYLAVAQLSRSNGKNEDQIRLAAALDPAELPPEKLEHRQGCGWDANQGRVIGWRETRYQALVLERLILAELNDAERLSGLIDGIRQAGLVCLPWDANHSAAQRLRERMTFAQQQQPDVWPAVDDACLLNNLENWLAPWLTGLHRLDQLNKINLSAALLALLDYSQQQNLKAFAPERIQVPSGSRIQIDYSQATPVLAVKLQELFGLADGPRIANGNIAVVLHLLSPARRPLQITSDLAGFWNGSYEQVKKDMKGRYPKHPWPDDPWNAVATARAKPRGKSS